MDLIGNIRPGLLFIISSPSGTGKTTLVQMLTQEFLGKIVRSITCTTRKPRAEEQTGKDYHFLSEEDFEKRKESKEFLEYANIFNQQYGTLKDDIEKDINLGKHVILVIDTNGALQIRKLKKEAVFIFISPPNFEELKNRLQNRKSETEETIKMRLERAKEEMKEIPIYDYHIVNDDLKIAYQVLKSIFIAEEHRVR